MLKVFKSPSLCPYFNLAFEDWLFREHLQKEQALFLWSCEESVVMGRFQNPWLECRVEEMEKDGVNLVRRLSGGGCVYHDPQNLNFTFFSPRKAYDKKRNLQIILDALKTLDLNGEMNERNDLISEGKKFSGSAFKENKDDCYHHGTLLLKSDLDKLNHYLEPKKSDLDSKGVRSVRSKVVNLFDINPALQKDQVIKAICESFSQTYGDEYSLQDICENDYILKKEQEIKDRKWIFEECPKFQFTTEQGEFVVRKGRFEKAPDSALLGQLFTQEHLNKV